MLPNQDNKFNPIIFSLWIILHIIYLKYFQTNNQHEEMGLLENEFWCKELTFWFMLSNYTKPCSYEHSKQETPK